MGRPNGVCNEPSISGTDKSSRRQQRGVPQHSTELRFRLVLVRGGHTFGITDRYFPWNFDRLRRKTVDGIKLVRSRQLTDCGNVLIVIDVVVYVPTEYLLLEELAFRFFDEGSNTITVCFPHYLLEDAHCDLLIIAEGLSPRFSVSVGRVIRDLTERSMPLLQ
jgi:hypothetical protein